MPFIPFIPLYTLLIDINTVSGCQVGAIKKKNLGVQNWL